MNFKRLFKKSYSALFLFFVVLRENSSRICKVRISFQERHFSIDKGFQSYLSKFLQIIINSCHLLNQHLVILKKSQTFRLRNSDYMFSLNSPNHNCLFLTLIHGIFLVLQQCFYELNANTRDFISNGQCERLLNRTL